jgi:cytochrome c oxidase cbb3-type subunit 1
MAYNVWRTVRGDQPVDLKDQPRVAAAPELRHGVVAVPAE